MNNYQFLESFEIKKGTRLKNRIVMAPMTTMSSFYNGMVTKDELDYYAMRSGGPGMIITAVANVSSNGKGFEGEFSAATDDMIPSLSSLAHTIKAHDSKAVLQIFHAGRKTFSRILGGVQPVSSSSVKAEYPANSELPRELENDEIEAIINDFGEATKRAILSGFDGVELHGANTYLLQQFYSPHSNKRDDKWGGDKEKRMTFGLAVINKVRAVIKEYADDSFILGYRLSPEEIEKTGITLEDSLYFAKKISGNVDYIHLSMGSYKRTSLNNKSDQKLILTHFVETLEDSVPIIGLGSVEDPTDASEVLKIGASLVGIGRELLREPKWVQKIQSGDEESIRKNISYSDMDDLGIPKVMQQSLIESFSNVMNFTTNTENSEDYSKEMAPMEGIEKKLL
ncbi:MAG: NADH-dependent flavin oxidoreductase [Vagococcus sp.]|uniref:NADH-dependent flavin oxidoreductase n=1 Tax=Vagococcus sp. TaxID=1933889 RepID=UPI002FC5E4E8